MKKYRNKNNPTNIVNLYGSEHLDEYTISDSQGKWTCSIEFFERNFEEISNEFEIREWKLCMDRNSKFTVVQMLNFLTKIGIPISYMIIDQYLEHIIVYCTEDEYLKIKDFIG